MDRDLSTNINSSPKTENVREGPDDVDDISIPDIRNNHIIDPTVNGNHVFELTTQSLINLPMISIDSPTGNMLHNKADNAGGDEFSSQDNAVDSNGIETHPLSPRSRRVEIQEDPALIGQEAPDGGWGWVVVLASFLIHVVADGVTYSFGVLTPHYIEYYKASRETVGWLASIMVGLTYCSGPLASILSDRFGFRAVTITGALMSGFGFGGMYYCSELWFLFSSAAVLCGLGFGFMYLPAIVSVGIYFEKKRALAIGLAVCGSGVGTFVFSPLLEYLLEHYSLQGVMLITGGIIFNCIPCGMVLLPPDVTSNKKRPSESNANNLTSDAHDGESNVSLTGVGKKSSFKTRALSPDSLSQVEQDHLVKEYLLGHINDQSLQRIDTQGFHPDVTSRNRSVSMSVKEDGLVQRPHSPTSHQRTTDMMLTMEAGRFGGGGLAMACDKLRKDAVACTGNTSPPAEYMVSSMPDIRSNTIRNVPHPAGGAGVGNHRNQRNQRVSALLAVSHPQLLIRSSVMSVMSSTNNINNSSSHIGSGFLTPPKQEHDQGFHRRASTSGRSTTDDQQKTKPMSRCITVMSGVAKMFDFHLLLDPIFLMLAISNFCTSLGFNAPFLYMKDRADQAGIDSYRSSFLISVIGIGNTVGRILFGALSAQPCVNTLLLYNVSLLLCGLATMLSSLCVTYVHMLIYTASFGLLTGVYVTLTSVVLVDLLGVDKLNSSFGLILLFQGVAVFAGPPMAGYIYDQTHSYDAAFWACGAMIGISGIMLFPVPCIQRVLARKAEARKQKSHTTSKHNSHH